MQNRIHHPPTPTPAFALNTGELSEDVARVSTFQVFESGPIPAHPRETALSLFSGGIKGVCQGSILFSIMASSQGINVRIHLGMKQVTVTPCMLGLMK